MSNRYKGAVISATPPTLVAGAGASGVWTLEQQMQATAAGLWPVNGPFYVEDVFSTYLYTGNGSTQTITNGIDLSGQGGLVWTKIRSGGGSHNLIDTVRGRAFSLQSNTTGEQIGPSSAPNDLTSFNTDGFSLGANEFLGINTSSSTYASWTFRKQPKFFDIVTYTGNGTASRAISHSLGSAPAVMIVKQTDGTRNWPVYHRSVPTGTGYLNLTNAFATGSGNGVWGDAAYNNIAPTSTVFYVGSDSEVNGNGLTYVAYIFAHDAGGFGLTGTDNVISCGSFTTDGAGAATVTLGYEPQWVMTKSSSGTSAWRMFDTMRGLTVAGQNDALLQAQSSAAEITNSDYCSPTATGFTINGHTGSETHIYIAIRRGPMKVPTTGTSVFAPVAQNASANAVVTTNFPVDLSISAQRSKAANEGTNVFDRLRGSSTTRGPMLQTNRDTSEYVWTSNGMGLDNNIALIDNFYNPLFGITSSIAYWNFRRAPSFFDEVCYTGTGDSQNVTHNLGVAPELKIIKCRSNSATDWEVKHIATGRSDLAINSNSAAPYISSTFWSANADTASLFYTRDAENDNVNTTGRTFVAYLFATCAGVSKVGSYTGTGAAQTINCGFTAGSRFVMIKRTDSTGDWYVWDSARGIVAGNDPYLLLNSTAAEVTNTDYVDTANSGFEISSTAPAGINANGGTYIFLAIA